MHDVNAIAVKRENDRIFREGSFPEMRSETYFRLDPVPAVRAAFHVEDALVQTDEPISRLMEEHGLKNQRIAREMFVKLYGERPLALRKKYRQA